LQYLFDKIKLNYKGTSKKYSSIKIVNIKIFLIELITPLKKKGFYMYFYSYNEFLQDVDSFYEKIKDENFDVILAIARGGVTFGHFLSEKLNNRNLYTINSIHYNDTTKLDTIEIFNIPDLSSAKKVLVLDDIVDSGDTMQEVIKVLKNRFPAINIKTGAIFYKNSAVIKADFTLKEATDWIDFFWVSQK